MGPEKEKEGEYSQASQVSLKSIKPLTPNWLWLYIEDHYGFRIPRQSICQGHATPFDYICGAFFERQEDYWTAEEKDRYKILDDVIVWACRSGLKTFCAGLVSHLECKHKPGCEIRALGGSGDQSRKMYEYFTSACNKIGPEDVVGGEPKQILTRFKNGSRMSCLTQSVKAVRGEHVQKLRCDEYDEFKREVIVAVQNVPASRAGISAGMEILSTAHHPYGPMIEVIDRSQETEIPVLKWCLWEVIERCPEWRKCEDCEKIISRDEANNPHTFREVCGGKAKQITEDRFPAQSIDDIHKIFKRIKFEDFQAENLCERPRVAGGTFYKGFDDRPGGIHRIADIYEPGWKLYEAIDGGFHHPRATFYQRNPSTDQLIVIDEYAPEDIAPSDFVKNWWAYRTAAGYHQPTYMFADPAATDLIAEFHKFGKENRIEWIKVIKAVNDRKEGARLMREAVAINDALGAPMMLWCEKAKVNRQEMRELHFPEASTGKEQPEWHVEVNDHGPDCNRYLVASLRKIEHIKGRRNPTRPGSRQNKDPKQEEKQDEIRQ
jgi:hypothetical protein